MVVAEAFGALVFATRQETCPLTRNDPSTKPTNAHDFTPVTTIDTHGCPAFLATTISRAQQSHALAGVLSNTILPSLNLIGVEIWIAEIGPDG